MSESSAANPPDDRPSAPGAGVSLAGLREPETGVPAPVETAAPRRRRSERPRPHREWRQGGSSTRRWGWELLAWAVILFGLGLLGSGALSILLPGSLGELLSRVLLWVVFGVGVVLAFTRSRPRGLLRFRGIDLLWGLVLGVALRLGQGWLEIAAGGSGAWPSYPSLAGQLPPSWWYDQLLSAVIIAPVLEEFFFRGVVLVATYTAVRRLAGRAVAAFAATVVSTVFFVFAHIVFAAQPWDAVVSLALVGLVGSVLVLSTGRIWGAVLVHIVYNGTWVALATAGTLLPG